MYKDNPILKTANTIGKSVEFIQVLFVWLVIAACIIVIINFILNLMTGVYNPDRDEDDIRFQMMDKHPDDFSMDLVITIAVCVMAIFVILLFGKGVLF